jgi:hypothetical protein
MLRLSKTLPLLLLLAGCAEGASTAAMTVSPAQTGTQPTPTSLQAAIAVGAVSGGKDTNPLWKSNVSDENFQAALQQSLSDESMLATSNPRYELTASLISISSPLITFNTTITADVKYTLTRSSDQSVAFRTEISKAYTATILSQPIAVIRLKDANEGAMAANISALIDQLKQTGQPGGPLASNVQDHPTS